MFIVRRTPRTIVSHTKYVSQFHTTGSALNIMDWFRSNKKKEQLMETVASATKEGVVASKDKLELIPENFIGRKKNRKRAKGTAIPFNEIPFNSWLSKQKVSKEEKLDLILKESLESAGMEGDTLDLEFPDLIKKFQFTKMLQAKTGYLIPDFQLTVLAKPSDFKTYFIDEILSGKLARFNEAEPNAIHLTKESYDAPNIYLENTIEERDISGKQQRKKFNTILKQMHDLDEVKTETLIENARRADGASQ
ncbi:hypothetical protein NCAS_0A04920 [Naumovozyma castellii]|uniref:Large ribosomal subunit protein mL50 n=1 Tax=Naumovozyma castellii TaxID=27288 RepID=G0V6F8_NAUCA|nr:hypothetical protein NCAS_0A04920 [Naumovozyma castellii CBS 4309]CCC67050.1 hypothetical protein NCAS_0A04920 [Naumovozyma castellii CBS 4309]